MSLTKFYNHFLPLQELSRENLALIMAIISLFVVLGLYLFYTYLKRKVEEEVEAESLLVEEEMEEELGRKRRRPRRKRREREEVDPFDVDDYPEGW